MVPAFCDQFVAKLVVGSDTGKKNLNISSYIVREKSTWRISTNAVTHASKLVQILGSWGFQDNLLRKIAVFQNIQSPMEVATALAKL